MNEVVRRMQARARCEVDPIMTLVMAATVGLFVTVAVTAPAYAVPSPPIVIRLDAAAPVRLPDGGVTVLPAGSEIGACGATPLRYELDSRVVRVPQPCIDEQVFADGFEAR